MSFLKITDPAKRDQTVKEFLAIRKNIRDNELAEKTGEIELQTGLSKLFKPITETQKTATKEITKGLKPIKKAIEQLPQQIDYPLSLPPSYRSTSPTLPTTSKEEEEEEEEKKMGLTPGSDVTFGIYEKDGEFYMDDKQVYQSENNLVIGNKKYKKTDGLMELITSKNPNLDLIDDYDYPTYVEILAYTNTMHRDNNFRNPYPKASRSKKWIKFVKPVWEDITKQKIGKGIVIPSDPNALLKRFDLLVASKEAGNTGVRNELVSVCDELKRQGVSIVKPIKN